MLTYVLAGSAVLLLAIIGLAGFVAILSEDTQHRQDARRVLKLMCWAVFGSGGLIAVLVRIHEFGLG